MSLRSDLTFGRPWNNPNNRCRDNQFKGGNEHRDKQREMYFAKYALRVVEKYINPHDIRMLLIVVVVLIQNPSFTHKSL